MDNTNFINSIIEQAKEDIKNHPDDPLIYRNQFTQNIDFLEESLKNSLQEIEKNNYEDMLCNLYIKYAEFESLHKQFKQAKSVYEKASNNNICAKTDLFWISYIKFYLDRKKIRKAYDIFYLAFQKIWNSFLLWDSFYKCKQVNDNYKGNLDTLKSEVRQYLKSQFQYDPPKPDYADISDYHPIFAGLFRNNIPLPNEMQIDINSLIPVLQDKNAVGIITYSKELEDMKYHEIILRRLALECIFLILFSILSK